MKTAIITSDKVKSLVTYENTLLKCVMFLKMCVVCICFDKEMVIAITAKLIHISLAQVAPRSVWCVAAEGFSVTCSYVHLK